MSGISAVILLNHNHSPLSYAVKCKTYLNVTIIQVKKDKGVRVHNIRANYQVTKYNAKEDTIQIQ